jgi:hypothetical protein
LRLARYSLNSIGRPGCHGQQPRSASGSTELAEVSAEPSRLLGRESGTEMKPGSPPGTRDERLPTPPGRPRSVSMLDSGFGQGVEGIVGDDVEHAVGGGWGGGDRVVQGGFTQEFLVAGGGEDIE